MSGKRFREEETEEQAVQQIEQQIEPQAERNERLERRRAQQQEKQAQYAPRKQKKQLKQKNHKSLKNRKGTSVMSEKQQRLIMAAAIVLVLLAGFLFSPIFTIKEIKAEGNEHFTTSELCQMAGLSQGDNLFFFSKLRAAGEMKKDPYIEEVIFSRQLPDTMLIQVKERKIRGYVPYLGTYLYIDEAGRVLDVQEACHDPAPMVKGLIFNSFTKGEILPVQNPEALSVMLRVSQMMHKYELLDIAMQIDVSDPNDVYADVNQVQFRLGEMDNSDQKIRVMVEVMKTIPKEDRGTMDLSDLTKPMIFQYLT